MSGDEASSSSSQWRKKGVAWTEEEHNLFLLGLENCGKGDWRNISSKFVKTRTPTQVASHAQKYFARLNSTNKDGRRSNLHNITSVNNGDVSSIPQRPSDINPISVDELDEAFDILTSESESGAFDLMLTSESEENNSLQPCIDEGVNNLWSLNKK